MQRCLLDHLDVFDSVGEQIGVGDCRLGKWDLTRLGKLEHLHERFDVLASMCKVTVGSQDGNWAVAHECLVLENGDLRIHGESFYPVEWEENVGIVASYGVDCQFAVEVDLAYVIHERS